MRTTGSPNAESVGGDAHLSVMRQIVHAVQQLSVARSLPDIQRVVRTAARELAGCDGATFILRENGMCHYADEDSIEPLWKGMRFPDDLDGQWLDDAESATRGYRRRL